MFKADVAPIVLAQMWDPFRRYTQTLFEGTEAQSPQQEKAIALVRELHKIAPEDAAHKTHLSSLLYRRAHELCGDAHKGSPIREQGIALWKEAIDLGHPCAAEDLLMFKENIPDKAEVQEKVEQLAAAADLKGIENPPAKRLRRFGSSLGQKIAQYTFEADRS